MCTKYWLSLPGKSVVRLHDRLEMTIAVDWDVKSQNKNRSPVKKRVVHLYCWFSSLFFSLDIISRICCKQQFFCENKSSTCMLVWNRLNKYYLFPIVIWGIFLTVHITENLGVCQPHPITLSKLHDIRFASLPHPPFTHASEKWVHFYYSY